MASIRRVREAIDLRWRMISTPSRRRAQINATSILAFSKSNLLIIHALHRGPSSCIFEGGNGVFPFGKDFGAVLRTEGEYFESWCRAISQTTVKTNGKGYPHFLKMVGSSAYKGLSDLHAPHAPGSKRHYRPAWLVVAKHFGFHRYRQQGDETEKHMAELRRLAKTCAFGQFLTPGASIHGQ